MAERRDDIAAVALRLFLSEGFASVSMRRLGKEVGLTPMALYRYYPSKLDILARLWGHIIATAFEKAPDVVEKVEEIVLMGGGYFEQGNITPSAEFNIYVDPEAADIVLRCGRPITMMPLDVTHHALTTRERVDAFKALGTKAGDTVAAWTSFFERFDMEKYGSEGAPLHDPTVIAYLIQPDLFTGRHINVQIETQSALTLGATVADWWRVTDHAPNATFMRTIDADGFFALLTERLARL